MMHWTCSFVAVAVLATFINGASSEEVSSESIPSVIPIDEESTQTVSLSEEDRSKIEKAQESHQYQAEVTRLMDIIINSLYTQKEVFLRELISNSVDALEKARFLGIADAAIMAEKPTLDIRVEYDATAKTLSIIDSGVGMTKNDLINNLGTVAKSGTSNFLEALAQGTDVNLIGQFGVGFYSAFLVADRVTVISKNHEDDQYIWESSADGKYYVAKDPRGNTLGRGSCVTLHLKDDSTEFLSDAKLRELVTRYSQFMSYPIYVRETQTISEDVPIDAEATEEKADDDDVQVKDDSAEKDKPKTKKVEKKVLNWVQVNTQKAVWLRPKEEVTEKEYKDFYRGLTNDWTDPLSYMHFSAEGEIEFKALLFIPKRAPSDVFNNYFSKQTSIKLYVRRVLVADSFDDLLPKYLHFIRGVVDSDDLPLNVSREQLQQHKILGVISKKLVRKTLDTTRKLYIDGEKHREELQKQLETEEDEDKKKALSKEIAAPSDFDKFYKEFSRNLMLGCYEDDSNRPKIAKVLQFYTNKSGDRQISLEKYIKRMPETQHSIFYAAGESKDQIMRLPQMQIFKKKDIEVVFLLESMDEPCIQRITDFEGKKFESIQKGDITLEESDDQKKMHKRVQKFYEPLLAYLKLKLGARVTKVDISRRLVEDPCAVVASQWGYSASMEKVMKTQTFSDPQHMKMMAGQKVFEINPHHKVIQYLLEKVKAEKNPDEFIGMLSEQLFNTAMLASGFEIEKPSDLASILYTGIAKEVGIDVNHQVMEDLPLPDEEEDSTVEAAADDSSEASKLPFDILSDIDLSGGGAEKDEL